MGNLPESMGRPIRDTSLQFGEKEVRFGELQKQTRTVGKPFTRDLSLCDGMIG